MITKCEIVRCRQCSRPSIHASRTGVVESVALNGEDAGLCGGVKEAMLNCRVVEGEGVKRSRDEGGCGEGEEYRCRALRV